MGHRRACQQVVVVVVVVGVVGLETVAVRDGQELMRTETWGREGSAAARGEGIWRWGEAGA